MSLDVIQAKQGQVVIAPSVNYTVAASLSSVATNQYPGGVAVGGIAGFLPGLATSGGGALYMSGFPAATTTGASFGQSVASTAATVSHNNAGFIGVNCTATQDNAQLVPPSVPGQCLVIHNCGTKSISIGTIGTVANWSTTGTVTAQVAAAAFTINSGSAVGLIATPFAVTASNHWPQGLWLKTAG